MTMKKVILYSANRIYDCSNRLNLECHLVSHKDFANFSLELKRFISFLGVLAEDDYWKTFTRILKRYRFHWSAAPIPFNYKESGIHSNLDMLSKHIINCEQVFSGFADQAHHLLDTFAALAQLDNNPLLPTIINTLIEGEGDAAILIPKTSLIPAVEKVVDNANLKGTTVVSASQLRSDVCFSKLVAVGSASWFPEYVFTAPRAPEIRLVKYDWLSDKWERDSLFLGNSGLGETKNLHKLIASFLSQPKESGGIETPSALQLDPDEIIPKVNWEQVKFRAIDSEFGEQTEDEDSENVEAFLFLLEGDMAVLLDSSEGARATIIDPDQESAGQVRRIAVADILPDMFILLRTAGGGEYIMEVADKLLGKEANRARDVQKQWKSLLRKTILQSSTHHIVEELRRLGSPRANEVNLRNWVSYRTIKTEDNRDFQAILRLIQLDNQEKEYWATMVMIDSAHRRAGQLIRKLLLSQIHTSNLDELRKLGRMDFEISEANTGSLAAFRVKYIHEEPIEVPVHRLGRPFNLDID